MNMIKTLADLRGSKVCDYYWSKPDLQGQRAQKGYQVVRKGKLAPGETFTDDDFGPDGTIQQGEGSGRLILMRKPNPEKEAAEKKVAEEKAAAEAAEKKKATAKI